MGSRACTFIRLITTRTAGWHVWHVQHACAHVSECVHANAIGKLISFARRAVPRVCALAYVIWEPISVIYVRKFMYNRKGIGIEA